MELSNKTIRNRVIAKIIVAMIIISTFCLPGNMGVVCAEGDDLVSLKFDLGANVIEDDDYIDVSADEAYDAEKGYGFYQTHLAHNVESNGTGVLSDAVHFQGAYGELRIDIPNGLYRVSVTTGNVVKTTIVAEDKRKMVLL